MESDGVCFIIICVDGGMLCNDWVMGFLFDILGVEVEWFEIMEIMVLGVVFLVGLYVGIFNFVDDLIYCWKSDSVFIF